MVKYGHSNWELRNAQTAVLIYSITSTGIASYGIASECVQQPNQKTTKTHCRFSASSAAEYQHGGTEATLHTEGNKPQRFRHAR